jgi:hypothetical protein
VDANKLNLHVQVQDVANRSTRANREDSLKSIGRETPMINVERYGIGGGVAQRVGSTGIVHGGGREKKDRKTS